jgi:tRNA (adenine22-N1)-methyltransferase
MQAVKSLGNRLDAIFSLVEAIQQHKTYDAIWDCGCDHGYLGQKILANELCETLYFVDQVTHIIDQLNSKLASYPSNRYRAITADVGEIQFPTNQRHLVILAGIGGERICEIFCNIEQMNGHQKIDYLLCPSTTSYELREYLSTTAFDLHHESIVSEKGRDYEIIFIRTKQQKQDIRKVSLTGAMWDANNAFHRRHHQRLMTHYQRQCLGNRNKRAETILQHYKNCLNNNNQLNADRSNLSL